MSARTTILGAGVAGLAVAAELTARGHPVALVDPAGAPGPHGCSWWAGGMLAPDCEGETAEEPVVRLGRTAADWWEGQGARLTRGGSLVVALSRDAGELTRFARRTEGHQTIDRDGLARLEPRLAERFDRALWFPDEAHLDPRQALAALASGLTAHGIRPQPASDGSGRTIDCRGLAARDQLTDLRGVRGEMVTLALSEPIISRPVRLLHPRHPLYMVPRDDGRLMLGATQLETDGRGPATLRSVAEILNAAYALHPSLGEAQVLEIGADARPAFPDNLPRLRRRGDTIYVNGLFRHGFLLAPAMARMTADYLLDGQTPEMMDEDHD